MLRLITRRNEKGVEEHNEFFPTVGHILVEPLQTGITFNQVLMWLKIMYTLYKEMCIDESKELVKISMYSHIIMTVYNLSFYQRKSYLYTWGLYTRCWNSKPMIRTTLHCSITFSSQTKINIKKTYKNKALTYLWEPINLLKHQLGNPS